MAAEWHSDPVPRDQLLPSLKNRHCWAHMPKEMAGSRGLNCSQESFGKPCLCKPQDSTNFSKRWALRSIHVLVKERMASSSDLEQQVTRLPGAAVPVFHGNVEMSILDAVVYCGVCGSGES